MAEAAQLCINLGDALGQAALLIGVPLMKERQDFRLPLRLGPSCREQLLKRSLAQVGVVRVGRPAEARNRGVDQRNPLLLIRAATLALPLQSFDLIPAAK